MAAYISHLQSLKQSRADMAKQLEGNPLFHAIQLVDKAIAALEQDAATDHAPVAAGQPRKTQVQIDAVADAIVRHFLWTKNTPVKLTDVIEVLRRQNVGLPASQHAAIASLGALLGKRKEVFEKLPSGQWRIREEHHQTLVRDSEPRVA